MSTPIPPPAAPVRGPRGLRADLGEIALVAPDMRYTSPRSTRGEEGGRTAKGRDSGGGAALRRVRSGGAYEPLVDLVGVGVDPGLRGLVLGHLLLRDVVRDGVL